MNIQSVRKLHMGCGEPLSAVVIAKVLRMERRLASSRSSGKQVNRRFLRRSSDR